MKDLMEGWRGYLSEQEEEVGDPKGIETFEDLKKLLRSIELKRKGGVVGKKALSFAASLIPGGSAAKELFDNAKDVKEFLQDLYTADDNFKTQTRLDTLNIDDNVSKIVDDQVEAAFLKVLPNLIADKTGPIGDFNITKELQVFLASKFNNTTVKK
jgi:hypothetical protein|tara:strand:+ start:208 stop:675 length:468 start_codon:yes stop_codon:yes gene_type:complete